MYNLHGHPWAKILNEKFEKRKSLGAAIKNLYSKLVGEKSKEEKYFKDFFKLLNKNNTNADDNDDIEMKLI
jgi:hypothetical protein